MAGVRPRVGDADARIFAEDTFPFTSKNNSLPTLSYALENLALSFATLLGSVGSILVTATVFVPLGLYSSIKRRASSRTTKDLQKNGIVAIVTGASSGIGEETAITIAQDHSNYPLTMYITGRSKSRLESVAERLQATAAKKAQSNLTVHCVELDQCDLNINDKAKNFVKSVIEAHKRIDLLVANAGVSGHYTEMAPGGTAHSSQPSTKWGLDAATKITQINVVGTVAIVLSVWEVMRAQRSGQISVTGSSASLFGPPSFAVYSATKAYLYHFVQCLRQLSFAYGIRVNLICPGFIETLQTRTMRATGGNIPIATMGSAQGMASAIYSGIIQNRGVTFWPLNHNLPLYGCRALNPLCEELGRWVATKSDMVSNLIS